MIDTNHTPYFAYADVWIDSTSRIRHLGCSWQRIQKWGFGTNCLASPWQQAALFWLGNKLPRQLLGITARSGSTVTRSDSISARLGKCSCSVRQPRVHQTASAALGPGSKTALMVQPAQQHHHKQWLPRQYHCSVTKLSQQLYGSAATSCSPSFRFFIK